MGCGPVENEEDVEAMEIDDRDRLLVGKALARARALVFTFMWLVIFMVGNTDLEVPEAVAAAMAAATPA